MYTECPECHTFFKVTPAHLKVADGRVRCGNCSMVFNALTSLTSEVPASALAQRKHSASQQVSDSESVLTSDVEILESKADSFADIEVPGTDGSQIDSLSDLSGFSESAEITSDSIAIPSQASEKVASGDDSDLGDLDLSSIISTPDDKSAQSDVANDSVATSLENNDLSEINREIDDALDGLFDEGDTQASEKSRQQASSVLDGKDLTDIPDLDVSTSLSELDLEKSANNPLSVPLDLELDLSDEPESELDSKAKNKKAQNQGDEESLTDSLKDFELDDSFLDSSTLDTEGSDLLEATKSQETETSETYSGDSFVLEEIDGDTTPRSGGGLTKVLWGSIIFLLIIVLAGQFIYLKRETLVKYSQFTPILELECKLIGLVMPCEVPERKAPEMVSIVDRNVVSHPSVENALLITSTIKNTADFTQPFPKMALTFSDINQKIVARRMFTPEEYLAKDVNIENGMESEMPIKILLEIVDPGEDAVNFQFDFK